MKVALQSKFSDSARNGRARWRATQPPFLNQRGAPSSPGVQRTFGARGASHKAAGESLSERRPGTSAVGVHSSARLTLT